MAKFKNMFLKENPDLILVGDLPERTQEIVRWAYKEKYIPLFKRNHVLLVVPLDIESACMWHQKIVRAGFYTGDTYYTEEELAGLISQAANAPEGNTFEVAFKLYEYLVAELPVEKKVRYTLDYEGPMSVLKVLDFVLDGLVNYANAHRRRMEAKLHL